MSTATIADQTLVGKRVRAIEIPGILEGGDAMGHIIESLETTVISVDGDHRGLPTGNFRYKYSEGSTDFIDTTWYFEQWEVLEDTEPADPRDQQIKDLTAQLETFRQQVRDLLDKPQDVTTAIGEHLIEVATNHGYCSTYDDEVENLNGILSRRYGVQLPLRKVLVSRRVRIEGTVYTYADVYVYEGDDLTDTENWRDSDGDEFTDPDEFVSEKLYSEVTNNGFDNTSIREY